MQMTGFTSASIALGRTDPAPDPIDPLDDDCPHDETILVTVRGLARLALVAAETGARSERCGTSFDAFEWLRLPRALFGGRSGLEACLELSSCVEALLLHGVEADTESDGAALSGTLAMVGSPGSPGRGPVRATVRGEAPRRPAATMPAGVFA